MSMCASELFCHMTHAEFLQKVSQKELLVHSMEEVFRLSGQQATERRGPDNEKGESQGEDHTSSCTLPRHA